MHELSTERSVGTSPKAMLNEDSRALKFILKCGEGNCQELVKVFWGVSIYVAKGTWENPEHIYYSGKKLTS